MRDRGGGFFLPRKSELTDIVDRVGGGSSFASASIAGLALHDVPRDPPEFAVAGAALRHPVSGDFNRVSRSEVGAPMGGDGSGWVAGVGRPPGPSRASRQGTRRAAPRDCPETAGARPGRRSR